MDVRHIVDPGVAIRLARPLRLPVIDEHIVATGLDGRLRHESRK